jgi:hypothetical protein
MVFKNKGLAEGYSESDCKGGSGESDESNVGPEGRGFEDTHIRHEPLTFVEQVLGCKLHQKVSHALHGSRLFLEKALAIKLQGVRR